MRIKHAVLGAFGVVLMASVPLLGCGGGQSNVAHVKPGPMPDGQEWNGVYFNTAFGYLHMTVQGDSMLGKWKRASGDRWGEMSGKVDGNVIHFEWKEYTYGQVPPAGVQRGHGYFVYVMGSNDIGELHGEYGNNDDETGADWNCVKQKGLKPDLDSIKGDIGGADVPTVEGGGWK
jgi:hypothetical protein